MTGAEPGGRAPLPRLHVVTDDAVAQRSDLADTARAIAADGAVAMHARTPTLGGAACWRLARALHAAATGTPALVFVNDRLDVARAIGAGGLHLPGHGLPISAARRLLGAQPLIGRSAHDVEQAQAAHAEGADYVVLGPIWETASHPGRAPLGPDAIGRAAPARVIAIGGISSPERARICRAAGAYGVAAIRGIWGRADPGGAARQMLLSLR